MPQFEIDRFPPVRFREAFANCEVDIPRSFPLSSCAAMSATCCFARQVLGGIKSKKAFRV
ncbi:hypothetical protein NC653_018785 [Populus alba x Populus x berolinensis]|uniref:Uncharacterized protein n=1 Tax=Populus alba x Populus x berolinensis TaxID=444605 RepID=A0AAD6QH97_9ROSI|nr:hypothetical protein NC653_018785 [Populus alba x Populus x berolinensis]